MLWYVFIRVTNKINLNGPLYVINRSLTSHQAIHYPGSWSSSSPRGHPGSPERRCGHQGRGGHTEGGGVLLLGSPQQRGKVGGERERREEGGGTLGVQGGGVATRAGVATLPPLVERWSSIFYVLIVIVIVVI